MSVSRIAVSAVLIFAAACAVPPIMPVLSPRAQTVRVEHAAPPADARLVGPIEITDGKGCGIGGDLGTEEGAMYLLKETAAQRGIDFVRVVHVKKPYSGHDCYHQEYEIKGIGYALPVPAPIASPPPVPAPPAPSAPPPPSAPPAASSVVSPPVASAACVPPCSPGYECRAGVCEALCNPLCGAGQICRIDRVCVPAPQ